MVYTAIAQTAAVGIRSKSQIIIAADSKVGKTAICKIRTTLDYFYTISGFVGSDSLIGFDATNIIESSFNKGKTFIENINTAVKNIETTLPSAITRFVKRSQKNLHDFKNEFEKGDSVIIQIIFAGIEGHNLIMYSRDFKMHRYKKTSFTILKNECGNDCESIFFIGKNIEMISYAKRNPPRNITLANYAEKLIEESIAYNRNTVGRPIDILQIPRVGKPVWIQRKPQCQK